SILYWAFNIRHLLWFHGEGGIRTHDTVTGIPVFETGSFSHSDTSPGVPSAISYYRLSAFSLQPSAFSHQPSAISEMGSSSTTRSKDNRFLDHARDYFV